jgi:serine protease Do
MNKWVVIPIIIILTAGTIANGVLYAQESSKLKDTQSQMVSLGENFSALEGSFSALDDNVSSLEGNVLSLEGDVSAIGDNVSNLEDDVSVMEENYSTLSGDVLALEDDVSSLEGNVSTMEDNVSNLEGDVSAMGDNVSNLEDDVSALEGNYSALSGNVSALGEDISGLEEDVSALEAYDRAVMDVVAMVEPSVVRVNTDLGSGSGVIITNDGWVLTNAHVIEDASWIEITLMNGQTYEGSTEAYWHDFLDIAIVEIVSDRTDFPAAVLGSSADVTVGQEVVAVGFPMGTDLEGQATFTTGIVSAFRNLDGGEYIQTDAAINFGNSGGPLVNLKGEVIGINTYIWVELGVHGLAWSIPIDDIQPFPEEVTG